MYKALIMHGFTFTTHMASLSSLPWLHFHHSHGLTFITPMASLSSLPWLHFHHSHGFTFITPTASFSLLTRGFTFITPESIRDENASLRAQAESLIFVSTIYIWDSFRQNGPLFIIIKCYKIALHFNHNNFRTVKAIDFLFSTLYTTPFFYGKVHFGVLHLLCVSIATFDTPPG